MSGDKKVFSIGIAGLGTVGGGVVKLIQKNQVLLTQRIGFDIRIVSVSAGNKKKPRDFNISSYEWVDDCLDMAKDKRLDAVVEVMGGSDGKVKEFVETALKNKKHVVTANKALLAHHGYELAKLAEENGVTIAYEAAVAGGIPVIKTLKEGLAANSVDMVLGILNGTSNYILTEMKDKKRNFAEVLQDAQALGYAEADPTFDVEGIDAAHKLSILGALAFGVKPDFDHMSVEGISHITAKDIKYADELGYKIKLIGMMLKQGDSYTQVMAPCFVSSSSALGSVDGVFNAVQLQGDFSDKIMLEGRGAGEGPTASAVVADIIDLAKGNIQPVFGIPASHLLSAIWSGPERLYSQCYIHLHVKDIPGVIADITSCLKDKHISIDSFIQRGHAEDGTASVAIVTHKDSVARIKNALLSVQELSSVLDKPTIMRILDI